MTKMLEGLCGAIILWHFDTLWADRFGIEDRGKGTIAEQKPPVSLPPLGRRKENPGGTDGDEKAEGDSDTG